MRPPYRAPQRVMCECVSATVLGRVARSVGWRRSRGRPFTSRLLEEFLMTGELVGQPELWLLLQSYVTGFPEMQVPVLLSNFYDQNMFPRTVLHH